MAIPAAAARYIESPAVQIVFEGVTVILAKGWDSVIVTVQVVVIPQAVTFTEYVPVDVIVWVVEFPIKGACHTIKASFDASTCSTIESPGQILLPEGNCKKGVEYDSIITVFYNVEKGQGVLSLTTQ